MLKPIVRLTGVGLIFALSLLPTRAVATTDWVIDSFRSEITIQADGSVLVSEQINVDFTTAKHGIYRYLPVEYRNQDGSTTYTTLTNQAIKLNGQAVPSQQSQENGNLVLKIGDPDQTLSGKQTYRLDYQVKGVLKSFDDYDELYWNVTGHDWDASIKSASAKVSLPSGQTIQTACYVGVVGSQQSCSEISPAETSVEFTAGQELLPGEGLTVAVGYPKGLAATPVVERPKTFLDYAVQPPAVVAFLATLFTLSWLFLRHWARFGRDLFFDRKSLHDQDATVKVMPLVAHETVAAEYQPPLGLRPGELGALIDEKADTTDVTATIVDLAVRGYLKIEELAKSSIFGRTDYRLSRLKPDNNGLLEYERLLLEKLFDGRSEVKLSEMKNKFHQDLANVKDKIYQSVTDKKLFAEQPQKVRTKYALISLGIMVLGGGLVGLAGFRPTLLTGILGDIGFGVVAGGLVGLIISPFMPRRSAEGREAFRLTQGYKLFVSGTEKYRQPYFENQNIFMEVLPYAIVFGVTEKLAKAFQEMGLQPPQPAWYVGSHPFAPAAFASDLNSFSTAVSSTMASTPSGSGSGGGGFSGGGFGGGGGGSW